MRSSSTITAGSYSSTAAMASDPSAASATTYSPSFSRSINARSSRRISGSSSTRRAPIFSTGPTPSGCAEGTRMYWQGNFADGANQSKGGVFGGVAEKAAEGGPQVNRSTLARRYAPLVALAVLQLLIIGFVPSKAAKQGQSVAAGGGARGSGTA